MLLFLLLTNILKISRGTKRLNPNRVTKILLPLKKTRALHLKAQYMIPNQASNLSRKRKADQEKAKAGRELKTDHDQERRGIKNTLKKTQRKEIRKIKGIKGRRKKEKTEIVLETDTTNTANPNAETNIKSGEADHDHSC